MRDTKKLITAVLTVKLMNKLGKKSAVIEQMNSILNRQYKSPISPAIFPYLVIIMWLSIIRLQRQNRPTVTLLTISNMENWAFIRCSHLRLILNLLTVDETAC